MRLESFFWSSERDARNFFVPELAIVPRLLFKSSSSMPMPLSDIVSVRPVPSVNVISILGSKAKPLRDSSVRVRYLSLSIASEAFEISSRRKISLLE